MNVKKRDSLLLLALWITYAVSYALRVKPVYHVLTVAICFVSAWYLFRDAAKLDGKSRFFAKSLGTACLCLGIGNVARVILYYMATVLTVSSLAFSVLNSANMLLVLLPIVSFSLSRRGLWASMQFLLDIGMISALAFSVVFNSVLGRSIARVFVQSGMNGTMLLVTPPLDILLISFTLSVALMIDRKKITPAMLLTAAGILSYVTADIYYIVASYRQATETGGYFSLVYMLAVTCFGLSGAWIDGKTATWGNCLRQSDSVRDTVYRSLFVIVVSMVAVASYRLNRNGIIYIVIALIVYQSLSVLLGQLLRKDSSLRATTLQNVDLEARIGERTRELRVMNQTLENLIVRDAITGLFNRKYFLGHTDDWIHGADGDDRIWLMIVDFNRFKSINDTYGHDAGDKVLRLVGKRLETIGGDRTVIARLGGDEFGIACLRKRNESIDPMVKIVTDLCDCPIEIGQFTVHITVSVGVSVWPDDAASRSDLMRHADIAMYIAKNRREGGVSFFDRSINERVERANKIDLALRKVDYDGEFELNFQPQITVGGQRLVGAEALVRWNSSVLGIVHPDEFIPVAEENGTIIAMSDWIMRRAFLRVSDWNRRYGKALLMGVNISPIQMDAPDFLSKLESLLGETKALPGWINLEMTERSAMKDAPFIIEIFDRLAALSVTTSIDDFGTGYSSLSYLKKFSIDYIKIAKELIDGIAESETDRDIVQAIIMMSTALRLHTIAEGVEDESQLRILTSLGCDEIQGYYFGKPVSADEFEELFLKE
jgi:diguanylate cyclase